MVTRGYPRRSILRTAGVGIGLAAVGGIPGVAAGEASEGAPEVAWVRSYPGDEREYEHTPRTVRQTADGGYVLGGEGAPIHRTGPEDTQFSCMKLDEEGEPQWIAFGLDDHERKLDRAMDLVQLPDGGFALIGEGEYNERYEQERWYEPVARAIKFTPDGAVEWAAVFDQFADDADAAIAVDDSPRFAALAPPVDAGGPVAVGAQGREGWAVKFAADGSVAWQRTYEDAVRLAEAFGTADGYGFHAVREDEQAILQVDASGALQREIVLDIDFETVPYNHVVIPTTDGGYAMTGRYDGRQRMVLQKFDEAGQAEWLETYNGPYDGYDWAFDLAQTNDGGFALFGRMDAAYTGDSVPAVVKTDATGAEEWQTLLEDEPRSQYQMGAQTSDGGYVGFNSGSHNFLVRYQPDSSEAEGNAAAENRKSEDGADDDEEAGGEDGADGEEDTGDENGTDVDADPNTGDENDADDEQQGADGTTETDDGTDDGEASDGTGGDTDGSDSNTGNEEAASENEPANQRDEDDQIPGFGVGAAVGGIGGALLYYLTGQNGAADRPGADEVE